MKRMIATLITFFIAISLLTGCNAVPEKIQLSDTELSMTVGDSKNLSVNSISGNASLNKLTWSSSDSNIATVTDGSVKAKSAGSAVITVTTESGITSSCNVSVADKEITKITLDSQTTSLDVGKTIQLKANFTPSDATKTNLSWSSSDGSVAMVNSEGYVTGISEGVVNIVCKSDNDIEASCTVTVKGKFSDSNNNNNNSKASDTGTTYIYYGHFNPSYVYRASDFVFPESSSRQLTRSEISSVLSGMVGSPVSDSFAQDAINEIYARNGYVFKTESIRKYYESKPWYYADPGFTISDFNSYESYNIKLLTDYS